MTPTNRMFAILDVLDEHETFDPTMLVTPENSKSSVYRNVRELTDAGLLQRLKPGLYGPGPRYKRQPPGTKFDRETRERALYTMARNLLKKPEGKGKRMTRPEVAKILNIGVPTLRRILDKY